MGDVLYDDLRQETLNDSLLNDRTADTWRRPVQMIHHMIHYRVVSELLIPIDQVEDAKELFFVTRGILNGMLLHDSCTTMLIAIFQRFPPLI